MSKSDTTVVLVDDLSSDDTCLLLDRGADDYLCAPYHGGVLLARLAR